MMTLAVCEVQESEDEIDFRYVGNCIMGSSILDDGISDSFRKFGCV